MQTRGFQCDAPECKVFATGSTLPSGWLVLNVVTPHDHSAGIFELCSNRCLLNLAKGRVATDRLTEPSQPTEPKQSRSTTCSVDDCDNPVASRGWCHKHYKRWQKYGDPLAVSNQGRRIVNESDKPIAVGSKKGKSGRVYSPEAQAKFRRNGLKRAHDWHHIRDPRPDCEWCEAETAVSTGS